MMPPPHDNRRDTRAARWPLAALRACLLGVAVGNAMAAGLGELMCDCPGPDVPLGNNANCMEACFPSSKPAAKPLSSPVTDPSVDDSAAHLKQAQDAARAKQQQEEAFRKDMTGLRGQLKLDLDAAPGKARVQLDCAAAAAAFAAGTGSQADVQNCKPPSVSIPEPSAPAPEAGPAPTDPEQLRLWLDNLHARQADTRKALNEQEREISIRQEEVRREQAPDPRTGLKPATESDALRKAREALRKAREAHAKASADLAGLEAQEKSARPAGGP